MKIRITEEHLKDAEYLSNTDCPLARALKGRGYKDVNVGGEFACVNKKGKRITLKFEPFEGLVIAGKPFTVDVFKEI